MFKEQKKQIKDVKTQINEQAKVRILTIEQEEELARQRAEIEKYQAEQLEEKKLQRITSINDALNNIKNLKKHIIVSTPITYNEIPNIISIGVEDNIIIQNQLNTNDENFIKTFNDQLQELKSSSLQKTQNSDNVLTNINSLLGSANRLINIGKNIIENFIMDRISELISLLDISKKVRSVFNTFLNSLINVLTFSPKSITEITNTINSINELKNVLSNLTELTNSRDEIINKMNDMEKIKQFATVQKLQNNIIPIINIAKSEISLINSLINNINSKLNIIINNNILGTLEKLGNDIKNGLVKLGDDIKDVGNDIKDGWNSIF